MTAIAIIVGSQLGSAEYVADQLQAALQDQHIESELYLTPDNSRCFYQELAASAFSFSKPAFVSVNQFILNLLFF